MADTRRDFLLRFAAAALAAAGGSRDAFADDNGEPRIRALYGPPSSFEPVTRPGCGDDGKSPCPPDNAEPKVDVPAKPKDKIRKRRPKAPAPDGPHD